MRGLLGMWKRSLWASVTQHARLEFLIETVLKGGHWGKEVPKRKKSLPAVGGEAWVGAMGEP